MTNTRKKLIIQIGTQEHVIAVYEPDLGRWMSLDADRVRAALADAYLAFATSHGITDLDEAGPSTIRVEDA